MYVFCSAFACLGGVTPVQGFRKNWCQVARNFCLAACNFCTTAESSNFEKQTCVVVVMLAVRLAALKFSLKRLAACAGGLSRVSN